MRLRWKPERAFWKYTITRRGDFQETTKSDASPLTAADRASHDIIVKALKEAYPEIPIISEEGRDIPYEERKDWGVFLVRGPAGWYQGIYQEKWGVYSQYRARSFG
jgi:3'-phosphoadenosine 5'-phosphosulfate (PAPS) 3'-phosphatase